MKKSIMALASIAALYGSAASAAMITFDYTGAIVTWVAPTTTTYTVTATGAQGAAGDSDWAGGRGAQIGGDFNIVAGATYYIAVGGAGVASAPGTDSGSGGGGGGTFFVGAGDTPLLIAGGGGGTRAAVDQNGTDASITTAAYTSSGSASAYTPTLKASGIGEGGIATANSWGSGGGGFNSDGGNDSTFGTGGASWLNGLAGGGMGSYSCSYGEATGGFGGGGAGNGCWGGGGGGGYSGGDGGRVAGGGGSFNAGYNTFALAGVGYGNGTLTISWDGEMMSAVPLPAGLPLLAGALGLLGVARRRAKTKA